MARINLFVTMAFVLCYGGFIASAGDSKHVDEFYDDKPAFYDDYQEKFTKKFLPITKHPTDLHNHEEFNEGINYYEFNCNSRTKLMRPYAVKSNGKNITVVQTDFFQQQFLTTECLSDDDGDAKEECFQGLTPFSPGKCKTKTNTINLYVYNDVKEKVENLRVTYNACCICDVID